MYQKINNLLLLVLILAVLLILVTLATRTYAHIGIFGRLASPQNTNLIELIATKNQITSFKQMASAQNTILIENVNP